MKRCEFHAVLFLSILILAGCGGGGSNSTSNAASAQEGGISFEFDLNSLQSDSVRASKAFLLDVSPTITGVAVTLSRTGYASILRNLTVAGSIATGQIDGLASGYWHVSVEVYENANIIYTGSADVNVISGTVVQCTILFDPVVTDPTTGSIFIRVGINPMPGYTALSQAVDDILFARANGKFYILDGFAKNIGVYDASTMTRVMDLPLASAPLSIALNPAGTGIYLGYPSGQIYSLDVATGQSSLLGDALMEVRKMAPLNSQFLIVKGPDIWNNEIKVMNITNGQIASSKTIFYNLTDLIYNPLAKTVYSHHTGVSPTDIHYIKVNEATGAILSEGDSIYHGDYSMGIPLRLINNGTRIVSSSGNMFTSAELTTNDLRYGGSLGYAYVDVSADDALGKLYFLNSGTIQKLLVMDQTTYFLEMTVELSGTPKRVFNTPDSIIVFTTKDSRYYAKAFSKTDLGL